MTQPVVYYLDKMEHTPITADSVDELPTLDTTGSDPEVTASLTAAVIETRIDAHGVPLAARVREFWARRDLFFFFVWRDLLVRYKQTVLGAAWAVLKPLMSMIIFSVFLGFIAKFPSDGIPYPVFYYSALTVWSYISSAVVMSGESLTSAAGMLTKIYIPRIFVPLSPVISGLVDLLISLTLLLVLTFLYGFWPSARLLLIPVLILMSALLALGVGLIMSPLIVRYRDFQNVLNVLIQVWMFVSPVIYPYTMVPERWRSLYMLNPLVGVIEGIRWALFGIGPPPWGPLVVTALVCVTLVTLGFLYFKKTEEYFADYV